MAQVRDEHALQPEPLPSGRHRLSAQEVKASQRERLLRAMLASVAERGYAATTVPAVVSAARVSRNAFYELFDDKESCFLAVCDGAAVEIIGSLLPFDEAPTWTEALAGGIAAYLGWWEARPSFARAYYVELPQAGRAGDGAARQRQPDVQRRPRG